MSQTTHAAHGDAEGSRMSDSHAQDPDAAPLRQDIIEDFAPIHIWIAGVLGAVALVAGTILGLVLVNN